MCYSKRNLGRDLNCDFLLRWGRRHNERDRATQTRLLQEHYWSFGNIIALSMAVVSTIFSTNNNKWAKACVIIGGCAAVGFSVYSVYWYFKNRNKMIDEGFEDISMIDDSVKKILVLGLDKAGKSSFLSHLSKAEDNANKPEHTEGFSVVSVNCKNGKTLNFWEIGGSVNIRVYWSNFVQDTDVLIYIVDSTDDHRLAESIQELHKLVACDRLKKVPIFILANKQDLPNASSPESIAEAFGVAELSRHNKVQVLPLQVPADSDEPNESVKIIKDTVIQFCSGK